MSQIRTQKQIVQVPASTNSKVLLLVAVPVAAAALAVLALKQPLMAIAAVAALPTLYVMMRWPDFATLAVIFVLYTNAAKVAVDFHGVPYFVGAAFPLALGIPLLHYLFRRREKLIISRAFPWILAFGVVQAIGSLLAKNPDESLVMTASFFIEGAAVYFLIVNVVRTPQVLRGSVTALLLAGTFLGSLSVYQYMTRSYDTNYGGFAQVAAIDDGAIEVVDGEIKQKRQSGPIGGQNRYAQIMLMLVPLGMAGVWSQRSWSSRALLTGVTCVIGLAAALTLSRGGAVAFMVMMVVAVLMGYVRLRLFAAGAVALSLILLAMPQYRKRLEVVETIVPALTGQSDDAIQSADGSARGRLTEMLAAGLVFADHPIIGVGPAMYRLHYRKYAERIGIKIQKGPRQAHSLYLGLAAETGTLGLITFGMVVLITLHQLIQAQRIWAVSQPQMAHIAAGLFLGLITFLVTAVFLHFAYIRYFWMFMGLATAAAHLSFQQVDQRPLQPAAAAKA